jgi:hypothetical protein
MNVFTRAQLSKFVGAEVSPMQFALVVFLFSSAFSRLCNGNDDDPATQPNLVLVQDITRRHQEDRQQ